MLKSYRTGALALAAAVTFSASAVQAEDHTVLIVDGSYFPPVTIASMGDNIIFINESGSTHELTGAGDSWTSGQIGASGSFRLEITEEVPATFTGSGSEFAGVVGEIVRAGG